MADLYHFWHVGSNRRRNHPSQILYRLIEGFGGYGCAKYGVFHWLWSWTTSSPCFDSRPYNSLFTHYRATLWCRRNAVVAWGASVPGDTVGSCAAERRCGAVFPVVAEVIHRRRETNSDSLSHFIASHWRRWAPARTHGQQSKAPPPQTPSKNFSLRHISVR